MAKEKDKVQDTQTAETPVAVDVAAIIAAAKEAAKAELKAEMQAEAEAKGNVKPTPMTQEQIAYWDELVEYSAPYVENEEDITVGHNGTLYKIKRGETVKIPRKVRQVILDSEKQKVEFAKLKKGLENQELKA